MSDQVGNPIDKFSHYAAHIMQSDIICVCSLHKKAHMTDNIVHSSNNIGIKHDFLCINNCRAPREMLNPEPERRGFQPFLRGPVDVLKCIRKACLIVIIA